MRKVWKISEGMKSRGLAAALALAIAAMGCQAARLSYVGAKVREPFRITLAEGASRDSRHQSPDVTIDYHVSRHGGELLVYGYVEYTQRIKNAFSLIPYFHLSVFLLDQYGNILEDRGVITPGSDDPNNRMRFSEKIQLPPGTAGMAFGYNGQARSSGGRQEGGGGFTSFWEVPIVR